MPRFYTVKIADTIAQQYTEWTRIDEIPADWVRVILKEDGTAKVWFSQGDSPPPETLA
jgi:hypothetical protein